MSKLDAFLWGVAVGGWLVFVLGVLLIGDRMGLFND